MLAEQLAAAGRKSGGQFASKEAGAVREAEVEEAVPDDEEPFQCDPAWFEGAEAVAWTKTDSAHTCLCCGKADCECVWSQRDIEANLATLDEHCAQHFTEDEDWSLQDWAAFTGRGPQQQEAAANEQRKRKTGWQQAEQARQEGGRRQGRRGSSKTLDQFGFTQTAAAAPVPVTVVDTSDEETDDGAAQLPLHYDRDYGELQRLLEDGVSCAKARGDWRDHLRYLATLRCHSLVAGDNPQERAKASQAVASVLHYRKGGMHDGKTMTHKCRAEKIRSDLKHFAVHRSLTQDRRGMHVSNPSRIFDEGFQAKCRHVIESIEDGGSEEWSAKEFHTALLAHLRRRHARGDGQALAHGCAFLSASHGHGPHLPDERHLHGRPRAGGRQRASDRRVLQADRRAERQDPAGGDGARMHRQARLPGCVRRQGLRPPRLPRRQPRGGRL